MTNVSQGGREDGLCPPGAAGEKTSGAACTWTTDSWETESPGKKIIKKKKERMKLYLFHVDLIVIHMK